MTNPITAMRAKLAADAEAARESWPEGSIMRPIVEAGISLRTLGIEVLAASRISDLADWLATRRGWTS